MNKKNKNTAALIAFFLGGFGFQWFYLGKTTNGVLSILFVWTGIPSFIALYHTIIFLSMSKEAFDEKYNTPTETIK